MGRARRQAAQRAFDRERDDRAARRADDDDDLPEVLRTRGGLNGRLPL